MCEVDLHLKTLPDPLVVSELLPVVRRDGVCLGSQWLQELDDGITHLLRGLAIDFLEQRQSRLAFAQSYDGLTTSFPDDGVGFPITQPTSGVDDGRTIINAYPVTQLPTAVIGAVPLPTGFLASQVAVKIASSTFVSQDVLIDPLMAYSESLGLSEPSGDLLRAPVLANQPLDQRPGRWGNVHLGLAATGHRHPVSLFGPVPTFAFVAT